MAKHKGTPRSPRIKYYFKRQEFDFFFQWVQGAQTHGGSEGGECFYAASRVKEGDEESWIREYSALAERVAARAAESRGKGCEVSAREGYLRAYTYLRSGLIFLSPVRERERYTAIYGKARDFFRCAARLFEPAIEPVEIAFEDGTLPAYFRAGSTEGQKRSTLIMIGGGDTFVEDLYAYIGPAAARRGWNLLMVDLPGQGLLPFDGMVWRADAERSISAVIDYLETRKEVDRERIAVYGISGGGYLAPRAAAKEKRIAACATCSIILDLTGVWNRRITDLWEKAQRSLPHKILKKMVEIWRGSYVTVVDTYVWRMGSGTVQGLVPTTEDCVLDPAEISCPLLNINSEQEYAESPLFRRWADTAKEKAPHPANRFLIAPRNEGGDSHAVGSNLSLMAQMVFDWLEEVFEP